MKSRALIAVSLAAFSLSALPYALAEGAPPATAVSPEVYFAPLSFDAEIPLFPDRGEGPRAEFTARLIDGGVECPIPLRDAARACLYGGLGAEEFARAELAEFTERYRGDGADLFRAVEEDDSGAGDEFSHSGMLGFYLSIETSVVCSNPLVTTFAFFREEYLGGAHPGHQASYFVVDAERGERVSFDDVFSPDARDQALSAAEDVLREREDIPRGESLDSTGMFFDAKLTAPVNIALLPEGVELSWNEYEIAPYAMGPQSAVIPYEIALPLMTPRARRLCDFWSGRLPE